MSWYRRCTDFIQPLGIDPRWHCTGIDDCVVYVVIDKVWDYPEHNPGFLNFLFYLSANSSVITCSPMKPRAGMYRTVWLYGWVFIAHMFRVSHKQWERAILILINTSTSIKIQNCENGQLTKSQEAPLLGLNLWPFSPKANPQTTGVCYIQNQCERVRDTFDFCFKSAYRYDK